MVIPALIDHLRSLGERGAIKANWIEDVYSEVLRGLLLGDLRDSSWLRDLSECVLKQLNSLAGIDPRLGGYQFGYRPGEGWGWTQTDR